MVETRTRSCSLPHHTKLRGSSSTSAQTGPGTKYSTAPDLGSLLCVPSAGTQQTVAFTALTPRCQQPQKRAGKHFIHFLIRIQEARMTQPQPKPARARRCFTAVKPSLLMNVSRYPASCGAREELSQEAICAQAAFAGNPARPAAISYHYFSP